MQRLRQLSSHLKAAPPESPPSIAAAPAAASSGSKMVPRGDWDPRFRPEPIRQPEARCLAGIAVRDVTPPPGIYNRNWGAAARDTSTGNHGALRVTALAFAAGATDAAQPVPMVVVAVDMGWLLASETAELCTAISASCGIDVDSGRLLVQMTHTHAGPSLTRPFTEGAACPGGTIALEWWTRLKLSCAAAATEAIDSLEPVWLTSALGRCNLAQQQEYLDRGVNDWVSTYNPHFTGEVDDTLIAVRIARDVDSGRQTSVLATLCNYGCHPQVAATAAACICGNGEAISCPYDDSWWVHL
eukprot:COSAG01_NODE_1566_length_9890_cov_4.685323_6_plen_300_part_00